MGQKASRLQRSSQPAPLSSDAAPDAPLIFSSKSKSVDSGKLSPKGRPSTATNANATDKPPSKVRRRSIQLPLRFRPSSSKGRTLQRAEAGADKENADLAVKKRANADVAVDAKDKDKEKDSNTGRPPSVSVLVPSAPNVVSLETAESTTEKGTEGGTRTGTETQHDVLEVLPTPVPAPVPGGVPPPTSKFVEHDVGPAIADTDATELVPSPGLTPATLSQHEDSSPSAQLAQTAPETLPKKTPRLRIAIIGGGIGGLSLATFLNLSSSSSSSHSSSAKLESDPQSDLDIDIYEAAPSLTELGAGVGMWLRTWRIMQAFSPSSSLSPSSNPSSSANGRSIGEEICEEGGEAEGSGGRERRSGYAEGKRERVEEEKETLVAGLTKIAPAGRDMGNALRRAFEFRKGDESPEGKSFYTMEVPFGVLTLHRADFQRVLAHHAIPPARPHFGKRLVDYVEDPATKEITLRFTDGTSAVCDLLVGADGIRSVTRGVMYRRLVQEGVVRVPAVRLPSKNNHVDGSANCVTEASPPPSLTTPLDPVADFIDPVWSGTLVYRALIPKAVLDETWPGHRVGDGPVCYFGKSKHVLAFPIMHTAPDPAPASPSLSSNGNMDPNNSLGPGGGTTTTPMINLVAFTSQPNREGTRIDGAWVRPAPPTNLLAEFDGWEGEVRALLGLVQDPLLWAIHTVNPLPRYSDGRRVVLLGDAAHAMTPHQGAGGGQAIEDSYVLAALLAHPGTNKETLGRALEAYDAVRVPVAQEVARKSRLNGMLYELNGGVGVGMEGGGDAGDGDAGAGRPEGDGEENTAGEDQRERKEEEEAEKESERLGALAAAIMEIHKWEWEEPADRQPREAVRLFEAMLSGDKKMRKVDRMSA